MVRVSAWVSSGIIHESCDVASLMQLIPCLQVTSNVDRGPLARKRDVGFIYHNNKMRELQKQAAELEVPFPYPKQVGA